MKESNEGGVMSDTDLTIIEKAKKSYWDWGMPSNIKIGCHNIPIGRLGEIPCIQMMLGYNPLRRGEWLRRQIRKHGWTKGAELGVAEGRTLFHLLRTCPALSMIGVDLFTSQYTGEPHTRWKSSVETKAKKYADRLSFINKSTVEAAPLVPDNSLDFIFIDADHSYEGVKRDIELWRPKVRSGGYLSGHDVGALPVRTAVQEMCPGFNEWKPDGVWWIKREGSGA